MGETRKTNERKPEPGPLRLDDPNGAGLDQGQLADDSANDVPKPTEKTKP